MIDSSRKTTLGKTSSKTVVIDILLSLLVGSVASLLICLVFYASKGAADPLEILPMFIGLLFFNSPYSYIFRLILLVPIYAPIFSILLTRRLIQNTTSRKSWILPILCVAAASALVAVITTIVGLLIISYGDIILYLSIIAISLLFTFVGFLAGTLLGFIFAPSRRIFKILIAVITAAVVGTFFEIAFLIYVVR